MSDLPKAYEPTAVEEKWYADWLQSGVFRGDEKSTKEPFSIVIPPPNVTGILTLGHVLNNSLQDILARRARMLGQEVLWLPGTDHAGIATQTVVERKMRKEEKLTRHDLGRDKFLEKVWEWKEKHGGIIIQQLKKLGCSCDWSRERFTMDEGYSAQVVQTFVDLYHKGLIYRGKRMVNWCPVSLTALSDEEVIPKAQKGFLYHFTVEVDGMPGTTLQIATTRPETIMGDTAVAVNPRDPRYAQFIGKKVRRPLPLENQALIPVIGDEAVEFEFGTGVLKVTPAHDKTDYEIGLRHGLDIVEVIAPDGTMNTTAGKDFEGLDRFQARTKAVEALKELGRLVKEEPYENNVGYSERADVPVEPRLSEQWFLKYPKTAEAREAVRSHLIRFYPDTWERVFDHWMDKIQDWCISRQLWWGHRIPVWYRGGETLVQVESPGDGWVQDSDVLDTWFSSWLWPYATMDDATRTKFYPTTVLVTGPDIIFFWVARMIMAGLEYQGEIPFRHVYFTGIIRDAQGRKLSKSLGNSPDPLDLIARFGADGLRFGLIRIAPQGQDLRYDEQQIVEGRNFCNKLWNACRFRLMQGTVDPQADPFSMELSLFSQGILSRLAETITKIEEAYEGFRFSEIAQRIYDFVWGDYCDHFVEAAKPDLMGEDTPRRRSTLATMDFVLSRVLRLLHPYAPFITEELWHGMGFSTGTTIQLAPWPVAPNIPEGWGAEAQTLYQAASQARHLRSDNGIQGNRKTRWFLRSGASWITAELAVFKTLLNAEEVELIGQSVTPANSSSAVTALGDLFLSLEGMVDVEAEKKRLGKQLDETRKQIASIQTRLDNPQFVERAGDEKVAEQRAKLAEFEEQAQRLSGRLSTLG